MHEETQADKLYRKRLLSQYLSDTFTFREVASCSQELEVYPDTDDTVAIDWGRVDHVFDTSLLVVTPNLPEQEGYGTARFDFPLDEDVTSRDIIRRIVDDLQAAGSPKDPDTILHILDMVHLEFSRRDPGDPTIVIELDDGVVQNVFADVEARVIVLDTADEEEGTAYVYESITRSEFDPERVASIASRLAERGGDA